MICVVATITVRDEKAAEFEALFLDVMAKVKANEPGNLLYQLTKSRTEPNIYKGLEIYRDQAALDQHTSADYFLASLGQLASCVTGTPEVEFLDAVE